MAVTDPTDRKNRDNGLDDRNNDPKDTYNITDAASYQYIRYIRTGDNAYLNWNSENNKHDDERIILADVEFFKKDADEKLTGVTASLGGSLSADSAIDGDLRTAFIIDNQAAADYDKQYIQFELDGSKTLDKIVVKHKYNYYNTTNDNYWYSHAYASGCELQGSVDGTAWESVAKMAANADGTNDLSEDIFELSETKSYKYVRYIRTEANSYIMWADNGGNHLNLADIEFYTLKPAELLESSLGWDGKGFTVNFTGEAGREVQVYKESADGGMEKMGEVLTIADGQTGVAISTPYTNRIYAAAYTGGTVARLPVKTEGASVYSLVIDELLKGELAAAEADPLMIAETNTVVSAGGMYLIDRALTEEADKIMICSADDKNTVTVKIDEDKLPGLNIGFTVKDGDIALGLSNATGKDSGVKEKNENDANVYRTLTLKITMQDDGYTVTDITAELSEPYGAGTEAVGTLSLESVNIEFVETLLNELTCGEAAAALDFVPEL